MESRSAIAFSYLHVEGLDSLGRLIAGIAISEESRISSGYERLCSEVYNGSEASVRVKYPARLLESQARNLFVVNPLASVPIMGTQSLA